MKRYFSYVLCMGLVAGTAFANDLGVEDVNLSSDILSCDSPVLTATEQAECTDIALEAEAVWGAGETAGLDDAKPKPRFRFGCVARSKSVEPHLIGKKGLGHAGRISRSLKRARQSALQACKRAHDRCEISKCVLLP